MVNQSQKLPIELLDDKLQFPNVHRASEEGLLAIGGDLSVERLLLAYRSGIFPWFNDDALILWWSPDPRMILFPNKIKISKSMKKVLKSEQFKLTKDTCFEKVIHHCSTVYREDQVGTWITSKMKSAFIKLHNQGHAHSYEVWQDDDLVGGLYGVDLGHVFCGESMFSLVSNASKFAFIQMARELANKNYKLIDCQVPTAHLKSLGAETMSREEFIEILKREV